LKTNEGEIKSKFIIDGVEFEINKDNIGVFLDKMVERGKVEKSFRDRLELIGEDKEDRLVFKCNLLTKDNLCSVNDDKPGLCKRFFCGRYEDEKSEEKKLCEVVQQI
jgi:Fe-S-cluster containining protein